MTTKELILANKDNISKKQLLFALANVTAIETYIKTQNLKQVCRDFNINYYNMHLVMKKIAASEAFFEYMKNV